MGVADLVVLVGLGFAVIVDAGIVAMPMTAIAAARVCGIRFARRGLGHLLLKLSFCWKS